MKTFKSAGSTYTTLLSAKVVKNYACSLSACALFMEIISIFFITLFKSIAYILRSCLAVACSLQYRYLLILIIPVNVSAQSVNIQLRAETWDIPRHGEALLKVPELATILQKWMLNPQQKIELRYPGGEEGELWVEELKDWLVSLGVPSNAIQVSPGSDAEDIINMVLMSTVKKQ